MFKINIDFNSLRQSASGSITGVIYLQLGESDFPEKGWNDFVLVIVSWWVKNMIAFKNSSHDSVFFNFMDGPFKFSLEKENDGKVELSLFRNDILLDKYSLNYNEIMGEFIQSIDALIKKCTELNLNVTELIDLILDYQSLLSNNKK